MVFGALRPVAMTLIVFAGALSAACTYRGDIDDPTTIKATWFSYLNGDDIRARCSESSGLRYRLIYNADYDEQLRSYEVIGDGAGGIEAGTLISRVHGLGRLPGALRAVAVQCTGGLRVYT